MREWQTKRLITPAGPSQQRRHAVRGLRAWPSALPRNALSNNVPMTLVPRLREAVARRARRLPAVTRLLAKYRKHRYENRIEEFVQKKDGHAGPLPAGIVYEATMRCNLECEFCYVGDLL